MGQDIGGKRLASRLLLWRDQAVSLDKGKRELRKKIQASARAASASQPSLSQDSSLGADADSEDEEECEAEEAAVAVNRANARCGRPEHGGEAVYVPEREWLYGGSDSDEERDEEMEAAGEEYVSANPGNRRKLMLPRLEMRHSCSAGGTYVDESFSGENRVALEERCTKRDDRNITVHARESIKSEWQVSQTS